MAHREVVPELLRRRVAAQLGPLLPRRPEEPPEVPQLAESLPLWELSTDRLRSLPDTWRLKDLVVEQPSIHHQVRRGGRPVGFAYSSRGVEEHDPLDEWEDEEDGEEPVLGYFASPLAALLDGTMRWIDDRDNGVVGDPLARLLFAPSFHLHAFWLSGAELENTVVVADFAPGTVALETNRVYGERRFLEALRDGSPIRGIEAT